MPPIMSPSRPGPSSTSSSSFPSSTLKRKRLRKKKGMGMRKRLRVHIESVDEFNPEARDAQSAELERIRRLEMQCSFSSAQGDTAQGDAAQGDTAQGDSPTDGRPTGLPVEGGSSHTLTSPLESSSSPEILQVEITDLSQVPGVQRIEPPVEPIIIESGSSDSDGILQKVVSLPQRPVVLGGHASTAHPAPRQVPQRLCGKYDAFTPRPDGRVLANKGHRVGEMDVFVAPQIAGIAKEHQVSL